MLTKTDALLYAKNGIRVNAVHPGIIWTPMVENFLKSQGDVADLKRGLAALHPSDASATRKTSPTASFTSHPTSRSS